MQNDSRAGYARHGNCILRKRDAAESASLHNSFRSRQVVAQRPLCSPRAHCARFMDASSELFGRSRRLYCIQNGWIGFETWQVTQHGEEALAVTFDLQDFTITSSSRSACKQGDTAAGFDAAGPVFERDDKKHHPEAAREKGRAPCLPQKTLMA